MAEPVSCPIARDAALRPVSGWRARTLCRIADIAIRCVEGRTYDVTIDGTRQHRVSVPARDGDEDLGRVVRASFEFLLEREPASSIMPEFSLD